MILREYRAYQPLVIGLLLSSIVGAGLLIYCSIVIHSLDYAYLLWNLILSWIPLFVAARLIYVLQSKRWSSWEGMFWSFVWLLFLPNSFYMISDFIHLQSVPSNDIVYFAVSFTSIIYTAVALGFISLYMVQKELRKRFDSFIASSMIVIILAACSLAIYIGRDLRLDSWVIFTDPGTLIFDISDQLIHVSDYPTILATGGAFFLLLGSMYFLAWSTVRVINRERL